MYIRAVTLKVCHAPMSVECFSSMTLLRGAPRRRGPPPPSVRRRHCSLRLVRRGRGGVQRVGPGILVPRAVVIPRPPQSLQMPALSGARARSLVVLPPQYLHVPALSELEHLVSSQSQSCSHAHLNTSGAHPKQPMHTILPLMSSTRMLMYRFSSAMDAHYVASNICEALAAIYCPP